MTVTEKQRQQLAQAESSQRDIYQTALLLAQMSGCQECECRRECCMVHCQSKSRTGESQ